jgi:class 3 adenylate cyclase
LWVQEQQLQVSPGQRVEGPGSAGGTGTPGQELDPTVRSEASALATCLPTSHSFGSGENYRLGSSTRQGLRTPEGRATSLSLASSRSPLQALLEPLWRRGRQNDRPSRAQALPEEPERLSVLLRSSANRRHRDRHRSCVRRCPSFDSASEQSDATTFAERLNEFYGTATKVLIHNEGIVDKLIGDEVMGLFIQGIAGPEYRRKAAIAALELASKVAELPLGVAANAGVAFVGNVGSGSILDFTALGDAVNVGARLQAHASTGEVVLAASLYPLIEAEYPGGRPDRVAIRGARSRLTLWC